MSWIRDKVAPYWSHTWLQWNLVIAVAVHSSPSYILDPMLDLSNPGIHAVAWTLMSIAHHTNLRKSK